MTKFNYTQPYVITAAFIVRDGKVLLIQENDGPDKGKWCLPGGRLELAENPIDCIQREVFEESGLHFTPTAILAIHSLNRTDVIEENPGNRHSMRIIYLGDAGGEVSLENGDNSGGVNEIAAYKWLTSEEILALDMTELRHHDIKLLVTKYKQGISYPLAAIEHIAQG